MARPPFPAAAPTPPMGAPPMPGGPVLEAEDIGADIEAEEELAVEVFSVWKKADGSFELREGGAPEADPMDLMAGESEPLLDVAPTAETFADEEEAIGMLLNRVSELLGHGAGEGKPEERQQNFERGYKGE